MGCVWMKQKHIFEDPSILTSQTRFSVKEVNALNDLFRNLSSSIVDDGFIDRDEFQLGLLRHTRKHSLLAQRMFDLFDLKHDGVIDFGEFVRSLSIFHPNTPEEEKAMFAFMLYDVGRSGFIQKEHVKEMMAELLDESDLVLSGEVIQDIVDKTFDEVDAKREDKIDAQEWRDFVAKKPSLLNNMTIPYLRDFGNFLS